MSGLSFCAIDFETANSFRGSPCAVGLARVRDGQVVATARWLMRPPEGCDEFDPFNVMLHGITPSVVRGEPRFANRLPEILAFAEGLPFVAHNAGFDLGVLRDACLASDLAWPEARFACSLVLSRRTYDLLSYSLPWVAEAAGRPIAAHHDPEADALTAAHVMLDIATRKQADSLEALLALSFCRMGEMRTDSWDGCYHEGGTRASLPNVNPNADPAHPFYGREMVFTGALASMTRDRAWALVAERGGSPAVGVTRHTDVLVLGYQDARKLRPGEELSAKARKAADLRTKGQSIELMPETDFVQLLEL